MPPIGLVEGPSDRRLRIGLILDSVTGTPTDDETRAAVQDTARLLEKLGHTVVEVPVAVIPEVPRRLHPLLVAPGLLHSSLRESGHRTGLRQVALRPADALPGPALRAAGVAHAVGSARTQAERGRLPHGLRRHRRRRRPLADARPHDAPAGLPLAQRSSSRRCSIASSSTPPSHRCTTPAGAPGVSLPLGSTADGLPIGVHFSALHGDERTLLEIAYELEDARPFARIQD